LIQTLDETQPRFAGIDAAVTRLVELLADRDILIVIDDVWDRAHLKPFMQGGSRCARLITTRNLDMLPANAKDAAVDAMQLRKQPNCSARACLWEARPNCANWQGDSVSGRCC
jgi:hypothetical protein